MKHQTNRNCGRTKRIADNRAKRHAEYEARQNAYIESLRNFLAELKATPSAVMFKGVLLPASTVIYAIEKELKRYETR